jgi:hypothetical protein
MASRQAVTDEPVRVTDAELIVDRLRALVREHPADAVPVIEVAELARILGIEAP